MVGKAYAEDREAFRKINRLQRIASRLAIKTVHDLADLGKFRAKEIAPYWSGRTAGLIRAIKRDDGTAMVLSPNSTKGDANRMYPQYSKYQGNFNLVRWMHETNGGPGHIKSGDPQYMYTTTDYLNRIKGRVAKGNFSRINLR